MSLKIMEWKWQAFLQTICKFLSSSNTRVKYIKAFICCKVQPKSYIRKNHHYRYIDQYKFPSANQGITIMIKFSMIKKTYLSLRFSLLCVTKSSLALYDANMKFSSAVIIIIIWQEKFGRLYRMAGWAPKWKRMQYGRCLGWLISIGNACRQPTSIAMPSKYFTLGKWYTAEAAACSMQRTIFWDRQAWYSLLGGLTKKRNWIQKACKICKIWSFQKLFHIIEPTHGMKLKVQLWCSIIFGSWLFMPSLTNLRILFWTGVSLLQPTLVTQVTPSCVCTRTKWNNLKIERRNETPYEFFF